MLKKIIATVSFGIFLATLSPAQATLDESAALVARSFNEWKIHHQMDFQPQTNELHRNQEKVRFILSKIPSTPDIDEALKNIWIHSKEESSPHYEAEYHRLETAISAARGAALDARRDKDIKTSRDLNQQAMDLTIEQGNLLNRAYIAFYKHLVRANGGKDLLEG